MEIRQNLLDIILLLRGPERVTQCQGKPRFFNRVKTGFEWNKYNQTHYDHDNPPPKIVQGGIEGCRSPNIFEYKSSWCRYYRNSTDYSLVFDDVEMCVVYPCSTPGWLYMSMRCHCFKFRLEIHHTRREIAGTDPTGEIFLVLISIHKTWDITDIPSGKLT